MKTTTFGGKSYNDVVKRNLGKPPGKIHCKNYTNVKRRILQCPRISHVNNVQNTKITVNKVSDNAKRRQNPLPPVFKTKVGNRFDVLADGKNVSDTDHVRTHYDTKSIKEKVKVTKCKNTDGQKSTQDYGLDVSGSRQDSKYDLGLPCLAAKCKKIKKTKLLPTNKIFRQQNKGFFGFIPLSDLPKKIPDC